MLDAAQSKERERILTQILTEQQSMVAKYKALIKHTGGMIETSMIFAYSKCFDDLFKLISKGAYKDEQKVTK
jgi:hypothetical protein